MLLFSCKISTSHTGIRPMHSITFRFVTYTWRDDGVFSVHEAVHGRLA